MGLASIAGAAGIGLACCGVAAAIAAGGNGIVNTRVSGNGDPEGGWMEAQSLRELPPGVQVLLGVGLGAPAGIADRGERFDAGAGMAEGAPEVTHEGIHEGIHEGLRGRLPPRRFALGIVNDDRAVVAVEQGGGGRAPAVQVLEFRLADTVWAAQRCIVGAELPSHGEQLLRALSGRRLAAARPCPDAAVPPVAAPAARAEPQDGGSAFLLRPLPGA